MLTLTLQLNDLHICHEKVKYSRLLGKDILTVSANYKIVKRNCLKQKLYKLS